MLSWQEEVFCSRSCDDIADELGVSEFCGIKPEQNITHAEVMTLVNRMLDRVPGKGHMLDDKIKWPGNLKSEWATSESGK